MAEQAGLVCSAAQHRAICVLCLKLRAFEYLTVMTAMIIAWAFRHITAVCCMCSLEFLSHPAHRHPAAAAAAATAAAVLQIPPPWSR